MSCFLGATALDVPFIPCNLRKLIPNPTGHPASSGPTNQGVHRSLTSHPWKNLSICPLTPEFSNLNHSQMKARTRNAICVDSCSLVLHHEQLRKIQRSRSCRNTHLLRKCNGSHDDWYALYHCPMNFIAFINSGWLNFILIAVGCCCYYFLVYLERT